MCKSLDCLKDVNYFSPIISFKIMCFNVLTVKDNYGVSLGNISLCVFSPEEYFLIPHSKAFILTSFSPHPFISTHRLPPH